MAVMVVVTMHRFLGNGVARKADCECDRSDKAFHHGSMFPIENARQVRAHLHRATRPLAPVKSTEMRPSKRCEAAFGAREVHRVDRECDVRAGRIDLPIRCGKRRLRDDGEHSGRAQGHREYRKSLTCITAVSTIVFPVNNRGGGFIRPPRLLRASKSRYERMRELGHGHCQSKFSGRVWLW
jgi:hypothetical protein